MTYVGPYSQATLLYESTDQQPVIKVATPGTLLDLIVKQFPAFAQQIRRYKMEAFYNSPTEKHTVFVCPGFSGSPKAYTVKGTIPVSVLKSAQQFLLQTKMQSKDLVINNLYDVVYVDGKKLVIGDIKTSNGIVHVLL